MELKVLNKYNIPVNVLHFQGKNVEELPKTFEKVINECELDPIDEDLTLLSCWTDDTRCCLKQQLDKFNIPLVNAVPDDYDNSQEWYMPNKIPYIINALKTKITTDVVMILDGYDVLLSSTKYIVKKFKAQKYHILFNSTVNNYPEVYIDNIPGRLMYDDYMIFFNAGCCIGYREDLIKFYESCLKYVDVPNYWNSEQLIIRCAFAEYTENLLQDFIFVDFAHLIFQTMGYTKILYAQNSNTLIIKDNDEKFNVIKQHHCNYDNLKNDGWYKDKYLPAIAKIKGES